MRVRKMCMNVFVFEHLRNVNYFIIELDRLIAQIACGFVRLFFALAKRSAADLLSRIMLNLTTFSTLTIFVWLATFRKKCMSDFRKRRNNTDLFNVRHVENPAANKDCKLFLDRQTILFATCYAKNFPEFSTNSNSVESQSANWFIIVSSN